MIPAVAAVIARQRLRARRVPDRWVGAAFAAVAYLPMLLTAPGRVSADTKTYLTVDPAGLLAQAATMWDPSVGAGTVPHQNIGYLFPLGPYYWVMEAIAMPDWLAQRLLWGTLVFAAGYGTYRLLRWLGWEVMGAVVAGAAYGLSPFLLSYLARLSAILGPWAALPWLLLFAGRSLRTRSWRPAAWFALAVALVGSVNATSLVLAGLGVVVWVIADVAGRRVLLRDALVGVTKIAVLCLGVSAWWIAGLRIQGAYGIPILRYTETYQAVASSSTPPEVLRGLGYWFFYGGDRLDTWVGSSAAYIDNPFVMLIGFALAGLSLVGMSTAFAGRVRAGLLLLVGMVVSVGAAPLDGSTLYGRVFEWFATESTAGAALRSTPRAAPLVILALAMGLGAGTEHLARSVRAHPIGIGPIVIPVAAVGLVCVQMFPWFTGRVMTPSLERDQTLPAHVTDLATWLDAGSGRIYTIPGSDFASYRWGGTVDPVLPGLTERDVLYRELVPQGGAGTADLLNAFERRLAEGWFEPSTLEPIAALFDVETVVVRNDLEHERYRLARPGPLWADVTAVLGEPNVTGPPVTDTPTIPLIDATTLADPSADEFPVNAAFDVGTGSLVSLSTAMPMVVAGDGDGLVDMAAAGLLDASRPVLYAAALPEGRPDGAWWVVTDTNRKQGRHWSTLGSNLGALEAVGPLVLDDDPGDQQLDVFPNERLDDQTVAVHRGDIADVRASYYGNRIAYTPEDAPFFAVDGDPATAWRAGVFDEAVGLVWEVDLVEPASDDTITVLQPVTGVVDRFITRVRITLDGDRSFEVALDERSRAVPGQEITLPSAGYRTLRIEVMSDNLGPLSTYAGRPGVGLAEVSIPGVVDDRLARLPTKVAPRPDDRLTYLLTRQRIDPATSNRSAPEPMMAREFDVRSARTFRIGGEARLSSAASEQVIQSLVGESVVAEANRRLTGDVGSRGASAFDGDLATVWQTPFDAVIGSSVSLSGSGGREVTDDVLTVTWVDDDHHSIPGEIELSVDGTTQIFDLPSVEPVDGRAAARIPVRRAAGSTIEVTITDIEARTVPEYFSGVAQVLPVGLAEVGFDTADAPVVASGFDGQCRDDLIRIDAMPVSVRLVAEPSAALDGAPIEIVACGPLELSPGTHRLDTIDGSVSGLDVDRLILDAPGVTPAPGESTMSPVDVTVHGATSIDVDVRPTVADAWLSLNQSWNAGWTATVDGVDLGEPVLVDGYANGWRLPASPSDRSIELRWTPQRSVDVALLISALFGVIVIATIVATIRSSVVRRDETAAVDVALGAPVVAVAVALTFFAVGGLPAALAAFGLALVGDRVRWLPVALVATVWTIVAVGIVGLEFRRDYAAGPDWPSRFSWAAPLTWIVVAAVVVPIIQSATARPTRSRPTAPGGL